MINIKETRNAKFKNISVLQGNYGYGWDDLCYYEDNPEGWKEQRADIKSYRENERGVPFRIISRKEPNPDYKAPEDRFRVYPVKIYSGRPNKVGETKKFTDMENAIDYANSLGTLCVLKDTVTGTNVQIDSSNDSFSGRNIDVFRNAVSKTTNEGLVKEKRFSPIKKLKEDSKKEMYHHIDNGYSMVMPKCKPININGYKLEILDTIDEIDNAFWFDEDEYGGFGGTQFFGVCSLRKIADRPDYDSSNGYNYNHSDIIIFRWWFNVNLVGDTVDETKIYLEIDNSLIESDLFEYDIIDNPKETNIPIEEAEDIMENNAFEIGEYIWNVIQANATGFGYSKSR